MSYCLHVSDLRPNITDKWQVNVMICRAWTSYNPITNRVMSFDLIMSDKRGCSIHAKIPPILIRVFKKLIQEGHVYRIHKFAVYSYETSTYRPLPRDNYAQFSNATRVYASSLDPSMFTRYVFEPVPFSNLRRRVNDDVYLTDVIGVLREWGYVSNQSRLVKSSDRNVRNIVIADECGMEVGVSLWGKLAQKFTDDDIKKLQKDNIVIVITSCKVRLFKGHAALMSTVGSFVYINPSLPVVEVFQRLPNRPIKFKRPESDDDDEDVHITRIPDLFKRLKEGVMEGTTFYIEAVIVGIDMNADWKYVQCGTCRKKTELIEDNYYCSSCMKNVVNPQQGYKLVLNVLDAQEELVCVLFNNAAFPLLCITAEDLLMKSFSEGADDQNWICDFFIDNLFGRNVIFKIKVDYKNLAPTFNRRFTVSKYLGDDVSKLKKKTKAVRGDESNVRVESGDNDDEEDFISKITDFEWDLTAQVIWGASDPSVGTSSVVSSTINQGGSMTHNEVETSNASCVGTSVASIVGDPIDHGGVNHNIKVDQTGVNHDKKVDGGVTDDKKVYQGGDNHDKQLQTSNTSVVSSPKFCSTIGQDIYPTDYTPSKDISNPVSVVNSVVEGGTQNTPILTTNDKVVEEVTEYEPVITSVDSSITSEAPAIVEDKRKVYKSKRISKKSRRLLNYTE